MFFNFTTFKRAVFPAASHLNRFKTSLFLAACHSRCSLWDKLVLAARVIVAIPDAKVFHPRALSPGIYQSCARSAPLSHCLHAVAVISQRANGYTPATQFSRLCGATALPPRFIPGTFTNQVPRALLYAQMPVSQTIAFVLNFKQNPAPKHAMHVSNTPLPPTLSSQTVRNYIRPQLLIATDPRADHQAIREASAAGIAGSSARSAPCNRDLDVCFLQL
jgi:hypothetical protein